MTPTGRTLDLLRRSGYYVAAVVETWSPDVNRRRDLFGCIDVAAVRRDLVAIVISVPGRRRRQAQQRLLF